MRVCVFNTCDIFKQIPHCHETLINVIPLDDTSTTYFFNFLPSVVIIW
jgi:hypothetical protein